MKIKLKAVDYLRCFACLFIINSHIAVLYPDALKNLAFGGYFGNNIFFFVSGFCLANINSTFPKWYRKRFLRVWIPYGLAIPFLLLDHRYVGQTVLNVIMPFELYHFIPTILLLYVFFYAAAKLDHTGVKNDSIILVLAAFSFIYFYAFYDYENSFIYEHFTVLEMISYFITMLLGARAKKKGILNKHASLVLALLCFGVYTYQSVFHFPKILGIFQLVIGVCFAYGLGCFLLGYEDKLKEIRLVRLISSVTLEAYIVHYIFIDVYAAAAFPTNLIYFVISLFGTAFCLQWAANKVLRVFPDFRMR